MQHINKSKEEKKEQHSQKAIPKAFIWRRVHSLVGLWLVLFLIEHMLTNSQAALFLGEDGAGFIRAVNFLHSLPYLPVIEFSILAVPIIIHMLWGIKILRTGQINSFHSDGSTPALVEYPRNKAYTWQRITSWILLFAIVGHVIHMRFLEIPLSVKQGAQTAHVVRLENDVGLQALSTRLDVNLYDDSLVLLEKERVKVDSEKRQQIPPITPAQKVENVQKEREKEEWISTLEARPLRDGEVIAVAKDFGTAELLVVREIFKSPFMMILYTIFVLAACFHGFNGFWTFLITWGITQNVSVQKIAKKASVFLMLSIGFLGLIAIWGTYWINLKQ